MDKIVRKNDNFVFPKVIDYACGAGHFLTEAVEAVNAYFCANGNADSIKENAWCEHRIFGVEKDYRLARVAKVSLYMNGAGQGKIKFGDGLEQYEEEDIGNATYDILVANPPYSVSGFKAHLKLKNNRFELLDKNVISNDGSEIETLFVERIAQLLKPKGIAAVVLPLSILSNDSNSYMMAREMLLQNFYLRAIVQFGSKTFGATGTNTVVLYLEKYNEPPKKCEIVKDTVNAILSGNFSDDWEDAEVFGHYIGKVGVEADLYKAFADESATKEQLEQAEYFKQYIVWFDKLTEVQNKRKSNKFKKLTQDEQNAEMRSLFFKRVKEIEREKLMFFALLYKQTTLTIIAPADNVEQKKFLGYDWSNRKGAEGIQVTSRGGMLYNDGDRYAADTLAAAVRNIFYGKQIVLPEAISKYQAYLNTCDMLDFSRTSFNKAIKLTADKKIEIKSKFPLVLFSKVAKTIEAGSRPSGGVGAISTGALSLGGEHIDNVSGFLDLSNPKYVPLEFFYMASRGKIKKYDLLICKDGALTGKVALVRDEIDGKEAMVNEHVFIVRCEDEVTQFYLFDLLFSPMGQNLLKSNITGSAQGGLNSTNLKAIKIPLPPLDIQQQIVSECGKIDEEYSKSRIAIEKCKIAIVETFRNIEGESRKLKDIAPYSTARVQYSQIHFDSYITTDNLLQNCEGMKLYDTIPNVSSVISYQKGDILVSNIRPYLKKIWYADRDGGCSPDVLVFRPTKDVDSRFVYYAMKQDSFFDYMMQGTKGMKMPRGDKNSIPNYEIVVPEDQEAIISQIEQYEAEIADAKAVMSGCAERKKKILEKYLN